MNVRRHQRRAISPIVATVLIVAATLIAFAAVAGYVFGIFGSAGNTANVSVTSVVFFAHAAATNGSIVLSNVGTATTAAPKDAVVSFSYGGATCSYTNTNGAVLNIVGGGGTATLAVKGVANGAFCGASAANPTPGESFTGSLGLTNGAIVTFSGTFSS